MVTELRRSVQDPAPSVQEVVENTYHELYPESLTAPGFVAPKAGYTLNEIRLRPVHSNVFFSKVNLSVHIGPVEMKTALLSASMDTVTGPDMLAGMHEIGGAGILTYHKKPEVQLQWLKQALKHKACLVANPKTVTPDGILEDAQDILKEFDFSTIPVVSGDGVLHGVVFTDTIAFKGHEHESIRDWMTPFEELKYEKEGVDFCHIKDRLLNEQECNTLPVVDEDRRLKGVYFMKDFLNANPSYYNNKPLVGLAVGVSQDDLSRVESAVELGAGIIVIDSSHGNSTAVIEQARKVVELVNGRAAVIAGNIADLDGYGRLAEVGVDAVKCGIGSGSICTTSQVTGAGFPLFTLIRELAYLRKKMQANGMSTPAIVADGGVNGPADMAVSIAAGADACMAGKWMVAATESKSYVERGDKNGYILYRGMASKGAIDQRSTVARYGGKRAPEGEEIWVEKRGSLKNWFGIDKELVQGGFAHCGASSITEMHRFGDNPRNFGLFSAAGQMQNVVRG